MVAELTSGSIMQNCSVISIIPFVKCLLLDKPVFLLPQTTVPEILRAYSQLEMNWIIYSFFSSGLHCLSAESVKFICVQDCE